MMLKAVLFAAVLQSALADLVEVSECSNGADLPYQVDISNCITQPCPFFRGENTTLTLDFFAPYYIEKFSPQVKATTSGVTITYPLTGQEDACEFIQNTRCPLEEDEYTSYTLRMLVLKSFPKVTVGLAFSLIDADKKVMNCFFINGEVVDR